MKRKGKWPNEEMWQEAVRLKKGGLTYSEICGQLAKTENMKRFGLKEVPSEDTVRREVIKRLAMEAPPLPPPLGVPVGKHHDALLAALEDLQGIDVFPPRGYEIETWLSRPEDPSWPITKGSVHRNEDGTLVVRLSAEDQLEWEYLQQHLAEDPVWKAIEDWKLAMATDMAARRELFKALLRHTESGTKLKVLPGMKDDGTEGPGLHLYYVHTIYDQVISQVLGIPLGLKRREEFIHEAEGKVRLGSYVIVVERDPKGAADAINFLLEAQTKFIELPEAQAAGAAYHEAEARTTEVKRHLRRILLAPGLPRGSICEGCRAWLG